MFKKYEKYKTTGVDWLKEIPEDWKNYKRMNWVSVIVRGNTAFKRDELLNNGEYIALQYGKTYKVEEINETFKFYVNSEFYKNDQVVHFGDTIIVSTSETIEDLGHSCFYNRTDLGLIGGEQILLKPNKKFLFEKFLYYYSRVFFSELAKKATGLKVFRFNNDNLKNIFISLPSIKIQAKMSNYLDKKILEIDSKISLLKKKKKGYLELKQKIIYDCVTRGLDKNVKLKESGIEWIGNFPKNWSKDRLKNIFKERVGKNKDKNGEAVTKNILSVMKDIGVINHRDKGLVGNKMSEDITGYKLVHVDDIVVNKMNVIIGSVGISKEFGALSVIYIILMTRSDCSPRYYDYMFKVKEFQKSLRKIATGILEIREAINMTLFKGLELPIPPKNEQIEIADYLDEKTKKIDEIVESIDKNIEVLKEFRKVLINDVVTGQIKVI